jgi:lipoprotein-anchoring transpeptidase ErfK/SrfK
MSNLSRRDFLKFSSIALVGVALPRPIDDELPSAPPPAPPPASLGRIAGGWRQPVREEATLKGKIVTYKSYDDVVPLLSTVVGEAPWPSNPFWFQTTEGFIHSAFVQPVENQPSAGPAPVVPPGIWVQVSVPIAETRLKPDAPRVSRKLYYGSVYRAVDAVPDELGRWWYRLKDGIAYSPGPYVLATSLRYLPPEALSPIAADRTDKKIVVDVVNQEMTCFEGETPIFSARTATGYAPNYTPRGEYEVLRKSHTSYMIGGVGSDHYDLPGVSFPTYFTRSAIAVHGTYWHNDYGRPRSHGCVNVLNDVAQFVFRWSSPAVPYDEQQIMVNRGEGTKVVVV